MRITYLFIVYGSKEPLWPIHSRLMQVVVLIRNAICIELSNEHNRRRLAGRLGIRVDGNATYSGILLLTPPPTPRHRGMT